MAHRPFGYENQPKYALQLKFINHINAAGLFRRLPSSCPRFVFFPEARNRCSRGTRQTSRGVKRHSPNAEGSAMSAIERCRTAALGGHVARCEDCSHISGTDTRSASLNPNNYPTSRPAGRRTWAQRNPPSQRDQRVGAGAAPSLLSSFLRASSARFCSSSCSFFCCSSNTFGSVGGPSLALAKSTRGNGKLMAEPARLIA
jgi:hypothetical protein